MLILQEFNISKNIESGKKPGKVEEFMRWYGIYPTELSIDDVVDKFNPYLYGYPWEVGLFGGRFENFNSIQYTFYYSLWLEPDWVCRLQYEVQ